MDIESIKTLIQDVKGHENILQDVYQYNNYRRDHQGVHMYVYVAKVLGQIVGVCVLRDEKVNHLDILLQ